MHKFNDQIDVTRSPVECNFSGQKRGRQAGDLSLGRLFMFLKRDKASVFAEIASLQHVIRMRQRGQYHMSNLAVSSPDMNGVCVLKRFSMTF